MKTVAVVQTGGDEGVVVGGEGLVKDDAMILHLSEGGYCGAIDVEGEKVGKFCCILSFFFSTIIIHSGGSAESESSFLSDKEMS